MHVYLTLRWSRFKFALLSRAVTHTPNDPKPLQPFHMNHIHILGESRVKKVWEVLIMETRQEDGGERRGGQCVRRLWMKREG